MYFIGLMSGTSADGIDAVLASIPDEGPPRIEQVVSQPFTDDVRQQIFTLSSRGKNEIERLGVLDHRLANEFAKCVISLLANCGLKAEDIVAIGSHGQTLRHHPNGASPFSLQIGNPSLIAELTGITTVADFRGRDIAAGGQGAPLVPAFHAAVFRTNNTTRAIVNIGGIANISILPADPDRPVTGFDTGPGNTLLDSWMSKNKGSAYDENGAWSAKGSVEPELLALLLSDPYFDREPPKSTGKEYFNLKWLEKKIAEVESSPSATDVQTTLVALTSTSIAETIKSYKDECNEVYICGGGCHNKALMESLAKNLAPINIATTSELGIDPDWVEALAFAWLAKQTLDGKPGNLPSVTGARHAVILGGIYPA